MWNGSHHGLYKVCHLIQHGECLASVDICRSAHLILNFGTVAPRESSSTILECCSAFFVNLFSDMHACLTIV
ncbi:hypothetical protein DFJ58DRAFT_805133 [Suillus subalutaceus]|uniref:uncharacterized protein n=1 Tax=Suillus subalutaceus TaxID=48586 RepID=UPI001B881D1D|nr:uncharacterized protein DFJ58DRAFT_805133 [Suillus subalutaceus]KAG1842978.1 hypothetical protein DFJ58DRAFT_805133 [Suillus subalutaceus]